MGAQSAQVPSPREGIVVPVKLGGKKLGQYILKPQAAYETTQQVPHGKTPGWIQREHFIMDNHIGDLSLI